MHQIYRIEHNATNVGPFQTRDNFTQALAQRAANSQRLRRPDEDNLHTGFNPWSFVFGCPGMDKLKEWVLLGSTIEENDDILWKLQKLGFVVREFLVPDDDIRWGIRGNQVLFDAETAREEGLVQDLPLIELMRESPLVFHIHLGQEAWGM